MLPAVRQLCNESRPRTRIRGQMHQYNAGAPFEMTTIDETGTFPRSHQGNRYFLFAMEYSTKWSEGPRHSLRGWSLASQRCSPGFETGPGHVGFAVGQSGAGAGFLRALRFPLQSSFAPPITPQSPSCVIRPMWPQCWDL
jgi:hypothetical protein